MNQYDQLKNKLHHYKVEIDKEKLWANTSHAIPQRKRRRAVLIMLFGTLAVSAWLLHSTFLVSGSERILSSNNNKNNRGQLVQNLQDNTIEAKNNTQKTPNTIKVLSSKLSKSVAELPETINPELKESFLNPVTRGENALFENTVNQIDKAQIPSEENTYAHNDNLILKQNDNENENGAGQKAQLTESIIPEQTKESSKVLHRTKIDINNSARAINFPIEFLLKKVQPIDITPNATVAINSHKSNIKPLKARFLKSLQMVQGFGFSTMKIQPLTPESELYASQLEQKIRSLEVLSTTLSATINLPEGFSLETGFQMSQLSTVIDHQWETNERIREEGVITIIIDEHGIPQPVIGNRDVTRATHYQAKRFTTHQNIDLVLSLQRIIWNEERLSMNAFVKGGYNFSYTAKGTTLNSNGSLYSFSKKENPYRRNSPFAIGGGLAMNYQLHPHWSLTGNFTFDPLRYQFKDENLPIRFKHSSLNFGLGIAYIF